MERWTGRVALVTGAGSGMGAATAISLFKHDMIVVGADKDLEPIQKLKSELDKEKGRFIPVQCDLTSEDEILAMFAMIKREVGGGDVCFNGAGVGHMAPLLSGKTSLWKNMIDLNIIGLSICTRESVQSMKERGVDDGHIFNMCSYYAYKFPNRDFSHMYAATKCAVKALTEGVRNELINMNSHIRITELSPGVTRTQFSIRMLGNNEIHKQYQPLESEDIASCVIFALSSPPHMQVHEMIVYPTEQPTNTV